MPSKAMQNYIYYKKENWLDHKAELAAGLGNMDIQQAYNENAQKLEAGLGFGEIPENFVQDVTNLLDMRNPKANEIYDTIKTDLFGEIEKFVSSDLSRHPLFSGGVTIGNANVKLKGLEDSTIDANILSQVCKNLQDILEKIDEFDDGFKQISKSEVSFLDISAMAKTKVAYDQLKNFLKGYGGGNSPTIGFERTYQELKTLVGSLLGDLKGGLWEYADYMHAKMVQYAYESVKDAVAHLEGVTLTGMEQLKVNDAAQFTSKADNIIKIKYNNDGVELVADLGISDKSYTSGKARGKSLASAINWKNTFDEAGLSETAFEYYYANMMTHERGVLNDQKNILNSYLAAKASAYIIAGSSKDIAHQAFFIRYANKIMWVPQLLRKLGKGKSVFQIKPMGTVDNTYVDPNDGPNEQDAYARTRNTINRLRQNISFNAYR